MIENSVIKIGISTATIKRVIILMIILAFFVVGHALFYLIKMENATHVKIVLWGIQFGICLFGSLFLAFNAQGLRSRKVFALELVAIGLASITSIFLLINTPITIVSEACKVASPAVMIYGNIFAFVLLIYPLELLRSNKMKIKEYLLLFLPTLAISLFYWGYIRVMGVEMTETHSWHDTLANIHKFDIWFRATLLIYPILLISLIYQRKRKYIDWCRNNFSNDGYVELEWLNYYLFGYLLILVSYLIVTLFHNPQSTIMHSIYFVAFSTFALFRIMQQEVPDQTVIGEADSEMEADPMLLGMAPVKLKNSKERDCNTEETAEDKFKFVDKIPQYKAELEQWMTTNKPFKDKDLKLLDVMHVLPLNRSYISRLFNEGYGESFFNFVMRYRIDESLRLLEKSPDLTITRIAELCGFSSPLIFNRAFAKYMAMTPKQYRGQIFPHQQ